MTLRRLAIVTLAWAGTAAATFLMSEAGLRVYQRFNPTFIFSDTSYNFFRGRPGALSYDGFPLNSRGFHDLERRPTKPPGVYRILGIGDSFVFGVVPHPHNLLTVLERELTIARGT